MTVAILLLNSSGPSVRIVPQLWACVTAVWRKGWVFAHIRDVYRQVKAEERSLKEFEEYVDNRPHDCDQARGLDGASRSVCRL